MKLFIHVGKFRMESFPVQVRGSRYEQIVSSASLSQVRNLEPGTIVHAKIVGKPGLINGAQSSAGAHERRFPPGLNALLIHQEFKRE